VITIFGADINLLNPQYEFPHGLLIPVWYVQEPFAHLPNTISDAKHLAFCPLAYEFFFGELGGTNRL
jgi:hypothetical protein